MAIHTAMAAILTDTEADMEADMGTAMAMAVTEGTATRFMAAVAAVAGLVTATAEDSAAAGARI